MSGNPGRSRGRRPAASSWEPVASWYDGWVGDRGSRYHQAAAIQDMDPLEPIFASLDWALRSTSRVVVLMTHPAFRQPRHAGWGFDESRKLVYRRVDAYLREMAVPMKAIGDARTVAFHRPISTYVNGLASVGFAVDAMLELPDIPEGLRPPARRPASRADAEIPLLLGLRAHRP